jgi:hypothetical protein
MFGNTVILLRLGSLLLTTGIAFPDFRSHSRRPFAEFFHSRVDQRIQLLPQPSDFLDIVALNKAANQIWDLIAQAGQYRVVGAR